MKNLDDYTPEELEAALLLLQAAIDNPDGVNRRLWNESGRDLETFLDRLSELRTPKDSHAS